MKIYTRKGDDGTTGLLYGGRTDKNSDQIELNGAVDETQAAIGLVRAGTDLAELDEICVHLERDLWILMAEVATQPQNRKKLTPGASLVDSKMIEWLESQIDRLATLFEMPKEFVIPGQSLTSARLDLARVTARRAERISLGFCRSVEGSEVGAYLNRLSDLLWMLARWQETEHLTSREAREREK